MTLPSLRLSGLLLALIAMLVVTSSERVRADRPMPSTSDRSAARPSAGTLEDLLASFAASGGVRARFIETRHLSILMAPIESRGKLYFEPPDRLARYTNHPGRASVIVRGNQVVMRDETGEQRLELGSSQVAGDLVGNLIAMLRGDLEALEARFEITFDPSGEQWVINLVPRSRTIQGIIEWIRFKGRGDALAEVETRETSGDTTVLTFSNVETGLAFGPEERDRIFGLERSSEPQ